jgi:hypothetical protein
MRRKRGKRKNESNIGNSGKGMKRRMSMKQVKKDITRMGSRRNRRVEG